jgi:catechol 2,3-dioxygenase-like lactoylglutathione lyase family enzyme
MSRLMKNPLTVTVVCGLLTLGRTNVIGQAPAASSTKGTVVGTGVFTVFVEDMDRSLAYYHDVFGMDVPAIPSAGERPYNAPNPGLFQFFDIAGAKERHQSARVPGLRTSLEFMEVQQVEHKTVSLRVQDPGAAMAVLVVRDVDAMLAQLKAKNAQVATPGGKAVTFADGTKSVLIRDIDQRFVELRQPATPPAGDGAFAEVRIAMAVNDMDRTKQIYRDVLGFKVEGETTFAADKGMQQLTGLSKAEVRRSRVQAPGSTQWIEFVEYKGVDRTPLRMKIQDRGAARLQVRVQNIDPLVSAVKAAGLSVHTTGGLPVPIPPNFRAALIADPNNFFLTFFEPCDNCAPRVRPATQ